jgi:hypothetical protein
MPTKPTTYPRWADGGTGTPTNQIPPLSAQQDSGWTPGKLAAQVLNWLLYNIYTWILWLDSQAFGNALLALSRWSVRRLAANYTSGGNVRPLLFVNALWLAFSGDAAHTPRIVTSSDSWGWTSQTHPLGATDYPSGCAFGAGLYVIVAANGKIITSPDGVTWTSRTSGTALALLWVTFASGKFVAVGGDGATAVILTSTDGITWTSRTVPGGIVSISTVAFGASVFVAVASTGAASKVITSPDGVTWTTQAYAPASPLGPALIFAGGLFVTGFQSAIPTIVTSPDGVTWTARTVPLHETSDLIEGLAYVGGLFVAATFYGSVLTSADGITWKQRADVTPGTQAQCPGNCLATNGDICAIANGQTASAIYATPSLT